MIVGTILSCERGSNNAAGRDWTFLSPLFLDLYPKPALSPVECLFLLGDERSHIALPRVAGITFPERPCFGYNISLNPLNNFVSKAARCLFYRGRL